MLYVTLAQPAGHMMRMDWLLARLVNVAAVKRAVQSTSAIEFDEKDELIQFQRSAPRNIEIPSPYLRDQNFGIKKYKK